MHSVTHSVIKAAYVTYYNFSSNFHSSFEHDGQPTFYTDSVLVVLIVNFARHGKCVKTFVTRLDGTGQYNKWAQVHGVDSLYQ